MKSDLDTPSPSVKNLANLFEQSSNCSSPIRQTSDVVSQQRSKRRSLNLPLSPHRISNTPLSHRTYFTSKENLSGSATMSMNETPSVILTKQKVKNQQELSSFVTKKVKHSLEKKNDKNRESDSTPTKIDQSMKKNLVDKDIEASLHSMTPKSTRLISSSGDDSREKFDRTIQRQRKILIEGLKDHLNSGGSTRVNCLRLSTCSVNSKDETKTLAEKSNKDKMHIMTIDNSDSRPNTCSNTKNPKSITSTCSEKFKYNSKKTAEKSISDDVHSSIRNSDLRSNHHDNAFSPKLITSMNSIVTNTSNENEDFTISRTSIENLQTPTNDDAESSNRLDTSDYLLNIVSHCQQSKIGKLTPLQQSMRRVNIDLEASIHNNDDRTISSEADSKSKKSSCILLKRFWNKMKSYQIENNVVNCGSFSFATFKDHGVIFLKHTYNSFSAIPVLGKIVAKAVTRTSKETMVALITLVFTMMTTIYPTVPRCNCGIASLLVVLSTLLNSNHDEGFYIALSFLVILTIVVDIDWLMSDYIPVSLQSYEQDGMPPLQLIQDTTITRNIVWYLILIGMSLKMTSLVIQIRISNNGKHLMRRVWKSTFAFFPPISSQEKNGLDIEGRVVAIIWLETACAIGIFSLSVYSQRQLSWSPIFLRASPFTPLVNIMYAKAITGVIYIIGLLHHTNIYSILLECRCSRCCHSSNSNDVNQRKVLIDTSFLQFNGVLKFVDIVISVFLWYSIIVSSNFGGVNDPKEVQITSGLLKLFTVFSSIYGTMLALIVTCNNSTLDQAGANESDSLNRKNNADVFLHHGFSQQNSDEVIALDKTVQCNPRQFEQQWRLLLSSPNSIRGWNISYTPTIDECNQHFASRNVFSIASGVIDDHSFRMFLLGQHTIVKFLAELVVHSKEEKIDLRIKSNELSRVPSFLERLDLESLFLMRPNSHNTAD